MFPKFTQLPAVTREEMIKIDELMEQEYGIRLEQIMENAGRSLARLIIEEFLGYHLKGKSVVIIAGCGGNAGGALACARHLHNKGVDITVLLSKPEYDYQGTPALQLNILKKIGVDIHYFPEKPIVDRIDLIVDGLIGYRLDGEPRGTVAEMIRWANTQNKYIISLDLPSGINATTGEVFNPCIRAFATLTLALPKTGLMNREAHHAIGKLFLADISVPPDLYKRMGIEGIPDTLFAENEIVQIR